MTLSLVRTNPEGMTWIEWVRAAGIPDSRLPNLTSLTLGMLYSAWLGGEDPIEWHTSRPTLPPTPIK